MNFRQLICSPAAALLVTAAACLAWPGAGCGPSAPPVFATRGAPAAEVLRVEHGELVLSVDRRLRATLFRKGATALQRLTSAAPLPLVGLQIDGHRWDHFVVRAPSSGGPLGPFGRRVLEAVARRGARAVGLRLELETRKEFPGALFLRLQLRNRGEAPLTIQRVLFARLRMDTRAGATRAFSGAALEWGKDVIFALEPGLRRRNSMASKTRGLGGGGLPLTVLWSRRGGIALGHTRVEPVALEMPLEVDRRGRAAAWIEAAGQRLAPGQSMRVAPSYVAVHRGDFYAPVARYRRLLAARGRPMPVPPASAYEPIWCSWGYEFDVRPEEVLSVVPKLKQLGIPWAVLDDRWFGSYGDWQPRPAIFGPRGEKLRQMVQQLHQQGLRAKLWWIPLLAEHRGARFESHRYTDAEVLRRHPHWRVLDRHGKPALGPRQLHYLCPALPGVQQYTRALTRRFIGEWGFDGHKLDVVFTVPPCHNPAHKHRRPEESSEAMAEVYRIIFETTRQLKPYAVTEICPCGTTPHHAWLPYQNQAVTADPVGAVQMRRRIKLLKALMGPRFAVYADHVELTEMDASERETGSDFASAIGTGAVVGTKFVWPAPQRKLGAIADRLLTPAREARWRRGLALYRQKMLSRGEYLNLYDLAFHRPEAHVVRSQGRLHYAFYTAKPTDSFAGEVTFRGPLTGRLRVFDYVNGKELGTVSARQRRLRVRFRGSLLVELRAL